MIKLGRHSYCYGTQRGNMNTVHVGNFSSIAEGVIFDGGFNHKLDNATTFPLHSIWSDLPSNIEEPKDIHIGHNVWIGEDAIIMAGVTIGNGAVIGARTIVTKDVPAYRQCYGAPMKINYHPEMDAMHDLMDQLEWWSWDDEKIRENARLLLGGYGGKLALANKFLGTNFKLD